MPWRLEMESVPITTAVSRRAEYLLSAMVAEKRRCELVRGRLLRKLMMIASSTVNLQTASYDFAMEPARVREASSYLVFKVQRTLGVQV